MTDIRGIRHIKTVQGLTSCTYWEAVLRVKPFYDKAIPQVKPGITATLFLAFNRESMKVVQADLERGTP